MSRTSWDVHGRAKRSVIALTILTPLVTPHFACSEAPREVEKQLVADEKRETRQGSAVGHEYMSSDRYTEIVRILSNVCIQHDRIDEIIAYAKAVPNLQRVPRNIEESYSETYKRPKDYRYRAIYLMQIGNENYLLFVSDLSGMSNRYTIQCAINGKMDIATLAETIDGKYSTSYQSIKSFFCTLAKKGVDGVKNYCEKGPDISNEKSIYFAVDDKLRLFYFRFYRDPESEEAQVVWDFDGRSAGQWIRDLKAKPDN